MIKLRPFRAIRPDKKYVSKVAALPYDVMNTKEAREIAKNNPYSFLRIDRAEIDLEEGIDLYDKRVYERARDNLNSMMEDRVLIKDTKANLYIYRQIMEGREQTGLVACLSVDDYLNNRIKKHENTLEIKEKDRTNHVDYCNANTGPIFLTYRAKDEINQIIEKWIRENPPVYDFVAEDGISHQAWIIDRDEVIEKLVNLSQKIDSLYIADGHHRTAAAVKVAQKRRKANPNYTGEEEFNYFLGVLFPHDQLYIMDYNRLVKDLNGYQLEEFIKRIEERFIVEKLGDKSYRPEKRNTFGMYVEGSWYKLTAHDGIFDPQDPIDRLDASILQNNLLGPILNIKDPRNSQRIDFVGGIRGLKELERRVNQDMKVAFSLYPTGIEDLMAVSDAKKTMPPKSTWFEPKLRSGIFIHDLE